MSKYEVTQKQWQEVMGTNPSHFKGDNRPVEKVTWYDAVEFCNRLSRNEGLNPCYSGSGDDIRCDFSTNGYRLPTEAEWEYAARGGEKSQGYYLAGSDAVDDVGWHEGNSGNETHPVGQKKPNELGFYDMSGNVWEFCWDWYDKYSSSPQTDPRGPSKGGNRAGRGGSWNYEAEYMLVATRLYFSPSSKYNFGLGFRLVRTAE
jgi:formylglycine-generating enzyme required for sulfatase activity